MNNIHTMEKLIEIVKDNPQVIKMTGENLTQSLPIPVMFKGKVLISFFYFTKFGLPPAAPNIYPPKYKILVDYESGEIIDIQAIHAEELSAHIQADKPLGEYKLDSSMTVTGFLEKQKELYILYDKIIPLFKSDMLDVLPENKQIVSNFYTLFNELAEKPLLQYYKMLNPQFYAWIISK